MIDEQKVVLDQMDHSEQLLDFEHGTYWHINLSRPLIKLCWQSMEGKVVVRLGEISICITLYITDLFSSINCASGVLPTAISRPLPSLPPSHSRGTSWLRRSSSRRRREGRGCRRRRLRWWRRWSRTWRSGTASRARRTPCRAGTRTRRLSAPSRRRTNQTESINK